MGCKGTLGYSLSEQNCQRFFSRKDTGPSANRRGEGRLRKLGMRFVSVTRVCGRRPGGGPGRRGPSPSEKLVPALYFMAAILLFKTSVTR